MVLTFKHDELTVALRRGAAMGQDEAKELTTEELMDRMREELDMARRELWLHHGHPITALYGDDGEMQCSMCAVKDWKRESLRDLIDSIQRQRMDAYRFEYNFDLETLGLRPKEGQSGEAKSN